MAATVELRTGTLRTGTLRARTAHRPLGTPLLRGRLHQLCAVGSVPAGLHLHESATGATARTAALVFAVTWTAMFTTSATYHRLPCAPGRKQLLRRADHSMIFVHIAGAMTPLCLLAMPTALGVAMLALVWLGAAAGVLAKATRLTEHGSNASWLYLPLGWSVCAAVPSMVPALGWQGTALLLGAGLSYSTGAICFFRKWPDPVPSVFGYHEVWHVFTLLGGACQYCLVLRAVS